MPRYAPDNSLYGHLTFALHYEGIDFAILNALFQNIAPSEIEQMVTSELGGNSDCIRFCIYLSICRRQWSFA